MRLHRGIKLGPYEILEPLGAGGMGEVYRARDARLKRFVAIKVLPARLAENPQALSRFEQEARAVAALSHPNILSLYDIGAEQGVSYAVTELLEGETLRNCLRRQVFPWRKAVELGVALAEGLSAAHVKEIIHRDLKPENIFLTGDGQVKILDFGLSRWKPSGSSRADSAVTETEPGTVMGTVGYMSPEQMRGGVADARTDIFSLGCVLYEMVAGRRAFAGESTADTISAILNEHPPRCTSSGKPVPPDLERLIDRCLQKAAGERFQSARDVSFALKDVLSGSRSLESSLPPSSRRVRPIHWFAAMVTALLAVAFYWFGASGKAIDSLAVLPFVNASSDPDAEYLSDGISETLMTRLSQVPGLKVKSRDSVFRYKGKDVQTTGRQLGVRAVLKGRIVQRDDQLSIAVELVDARDDSLIWRDQYNRKIGDILAIQEEISREVYEQLRFKLTGEERKQLAKGSTKNVEAYQLYLRGRYGSDRLSEASLKNSLPYFQQATEKDPHYALAWAGLAWAYAASAMYGVLPRMDAYPHAKSAAIKALEIEPTLAGAHTVLARINTEFEWDWAGAEREYQQAIRLDPNYASAHQHYAVHLAAVGRPREAIAEARRARELEPLSPLYAVNVGWFYYIDHQYGQAAVECRKTIEMEPNYAWGHNCLGSVYLQTGRNLDAVNELQKGVDLSQHGVMEVMMAGHALGVSGDRAGAQKVLEEMTALARRRYVPPENFAVVYEGMGDSDRAFQWFEKGYRERSMHSWIYPDPRQDPFRGDPRFKDLMRRMGLPQ